MRSLGGPFAGELAFSCRAGFGAPFHTGRPGIVIYGLLSMRAYRDGGRKSWRFSGDDCALRPGNSRPDIEPLNHLPVQGRDSELASLSKPPLNLARFVHAAVS